MDYLRWFFVLLAVFSAVPACTLLSPWRVPARAVPMIMIVVSLFVSFLPAHAVLAMAVVGPIAYLYKRLGIEPAENAPADYSPAIQAARHGAQAARTRIRPPEPVHVTEYATQAYPDPQTVSEADDDEPPELAPPASVSTVRSFVPAL
ncbi:MAG: hypothetical protein ACRDRJ_05040 [Streptosporangiaceae bacterium]